jgi:YD repeat-containing protein
MESPRRKRASQAGTTASTVSVSAASASATTALRRPPLEAALDTFTRELRAALDRASTDITALRAELAQARTELGQLRQRYDAHSHLYQKTSTGGGAHQWIELRFLQSYIDGENQSFKKYGFWVRAKSSDDTPPELQTGKPSA